MNFVSLNFWITLSCIMAIYAGCRLLKLHSRCPNFDKLYLLSASLILLAREDLLSFTLFLSISLVIFLSIRSKTIMFGKSHIFVPFVAFVVVSPLIWFKYLPLLAADFPSLGMADLMIPVGLSFYTFQLLALFIDERKKVQSSSEAEYEKISVLDFFNFASFFPQIVAGPIERQKDLMPQLSRFTFRLSQKNLEIGAKMIIIGFFYKTVIADSLAYAVWISQDIKHPLIVHLSNFIFGLRIYGDFCGYSLIAIGLGRVFGIKLSTNFLSPYTKRNVQEFWRSWHISLTQWFRDYIYIPLGGRKRRIAVLIVFLVSGVWHGAGWNFILWGAAHGFLLLGLGYFKNSKISLPSWFAWLTTIGFVSITWLFFYQLESEIIFRKLALIFNLRAYFLSPVPELVSLAGGPAMVVHLIFSLLLAAIVILLEFIALRRSGNPYSWGFGVSAQAALVVAIVILRLNQKNAFVYFSF